ncbi:MAG: hypothetical protein K2H52_14850 [Lachnospiraceae bacterium]|nr:hypothetical protein [Lachnospiraceae bacterium]MDE6185630.1 hypothetical protein [Lachnospiraceae bacterium]
MIDAFKPFFIYWTILILGCILFFLCPLVLFLFFPLLIIIIPTWAVIVYLIGNSVQQRSDLKGIGKRITASLLCSFLPTIILPIGFLLEDVIKWGTLHFKYFTDPSLWITFAIHLFIFFIGMQTAHLMTKTDHNKNTATEDNRSALP